MATQRVSDMTIDELSQLVDQMIDRRLQGLIKPQDERSNTEIIASIRKRRFTPPADAKSTLEMLRDNREA